MERFGFFLLLPKISTFLTNEKWTLKKLTKNKVDNYIEGEKEFTELLSNFTETPKVLGLYDRNSWSNMH